VSLSDRPPQGREEQRARFGDSEADFDKRQDRRNDAFTAFTNDFNAAKVTLAFSDLTYRGVKALAKRVTTFLDQCLGTHRSFNRRSQASVSTPFAGA
jgi:hypothetical protein